MSSEETWDQFSLMVTDCVVKWSITLLEEQVTLNSTAKHASSSELVSLKKVHGLI